MIYDKLSEGLRPIWIAAVLLTRMPLPHLPEAAFAQGAQAVWAYPLIGALLGAIAAITAAVLEMLGVPPALVAGALLALAMVLTGAMHEDGLADTADGFWGGHDPARRLEIMKDSHVGTFGVLALILSTGLRWTAMAALLVQGPLFLIAVAALSRAGMPLLMWSLPHARSNGLSHSVGRPSRGASLSAVLVGLACAVITIGLLEALALAALVLAAAAGLALLARRRIGGQTGDVLGAAQVLSETLALVLLVALTA
jgi:adenosylcobinamide-GDP ribazoletransferase